MAALLVLVAVGLLLAGLDRGSADLQWGSFAASALAAVLLVVSEVRSRRRARQETAEEPTGSPAVAPAPSPAPTSPDQDVEVRRALPPPVPPSSPAIPRVGGPGTGSGLGELAGPGTGPGAPAQQPPAPLDRPQRSTGSHSATDLPRVSAAGAGASEGARAAALDADGEPPAEEVEVTDLLLVLDLTDEVLVVGEHPRYRLAGCPHRAGGAPIALPMVEARTDGFTPCGTCTPDRVLAGRERSRRSA